MMHKNSPGSNSHLTTLISLIALTLIFVGITAHLSRHYNEPIQDHVFVGEPTYFTNPLFSAQQILTQHAHGKRRSLVIIGIFLLMLTPIIRVFSSFIYYFQKRDYPYIIITLLLWLILLYSLFGSH